MVPNKREYIKIHRNNVRINKMNKNKLKLILIALLAMLLLTACIPGNGKNNPDNLAGFFWGVWHGWIAPISLIGSIFNKELSIFETHNTGFWYNLGFYMAVISGFGGLSISRKRKKDKD